MKLFISVYFISLGLFTSVFFLEKTKEESIESGAELYQDFCVQCHLGNGAGVAGVFPPLKDSDYLFNNIEKSIAGIKYGLRGPITVNEENYDGVMLSQGLEDEEIADLMNYILNSWLNTYEAQITNEYLKKIQKSVLN
ncbi:MAG: cytochrome c [Flavobacteriaceae bacterium]